MSLEKTPKDDEGLEPLPAERDMNTWVEMQRAIARGVQRYGQMIRATPGENEQKTIALFAAAKKALRPEIVPIWDAALEFNVAAWAAEMEGGNG